MVSTGYLAGRTKWVRPQAMIWSDVRFTLKHGAFTPPLTAAEGMDFLVITDHNRGPISISPSRIESRARMISGTSRSHFTADKTKISTNWSMLPSRVAQTPVFFNDDGSLSAESGIPYVADNASCAIDMRDWHTVHTGSFYVYLSFDLGAQFDFDSKLAADFDDPQAKNLANTSMVRYTTEKRMFFESFDGSITKRGLYDMWDISVALDEV